MKTDRELLELAAKAAGIDLLWSSEDEVSPRLADNRFWPWNPLSDDGDALRLAVNLRITPDFDTDEGKGVFTGYEARIKSYHPILEKFGDDDCAATRRAIVRRAAEIGKAMP